VKHEPCRLLSDSQILGDFTTADPVFAVRNQPHRAEPLVQRERRILKDRPELYRELPVALFALPPALRFQVVVLFVTTSGADRAIRPTHLSDRINADLLIAEISDNLLKSLWFSVHALHYSKDFLVGQVYKYPS
jgi:hypothetical protein